MTEHLQRVVESASGVTQEIFITDINGNPLDCAIMGDDDSSEEEEYLEWFNIQYRCPECGQQWDEEWDSACDSECPQCGLEDIIPLSFTQQN
jgi:predicted RNA-binding Zn-ribbon protein involved in translation (DUF1610 family)